MERRDSSHGKGLPIGPQKRISESLISNIKPEDLFIIIITPSPTTVIATAQPWALLCWVQG
jgi:hypothetical protein